MHNPTRHCQIFMAVVFPLLLLPGQSAADLLAETVRRAVINHPVVMAAHADQRAAVQRLKQIKGLYLPTVDLSLGYGKEHSNNITTRNTGRNTTDLERGDASLSLVQNLFDGFSRSNKRSAAYERLRATIYDLNNTINATTHEAVSAYLDVLKNTQIVAISRINQQTHLDTLKKVQKLRQKRLGTVADLHQTISRLALAQSRLSSQEGFLRNAESHFIEIIGEKPRELSLPVAPTNNLPETLDQALDQARKHNAGILSAQASLAASQADAKASMAAFLPNIDLELVASNSENPSGLETYAESASAMLRFKYNLFRGGTDLARKRESAEKIGRARSVLEQRFRVLEKQTRTTWSDLVTAKEQIAYLEKQVAVSKKVVSAYRMQFHMATRSLLDVLNAESEFFNALTSLTTSQFTVLEKSYFLLSSMGLLSKTLFITDADPMDSTIGDGVPPDTAPMAPPNAASPVEIHNSIKPNSPGTVTAP